MPHQHSAQFGLEAVKPSWLHLTWLAVRTTAKFCKAFFNSSRCSSFSVAFSLLRVLYAMILHDITWRFRTCSIVLQLLVFLLCLFYNSVLCLRFSSVASHFLFLVALSPTKNDSVAMRLFQFLHFVDSFVRPDMEGRPRAGGIDDDDTRNQVPQSSYVLLPSFCLRTFLSSETFHLSEKRRGT